MSASDVIEGPLMDGMKIVRICSAPVRCFFPCGQECAGDEEGSRLSYPFMEAEKQRIQKALMLETVVLATVSDVHDIGKNIVGVVLACNNYTVIDLGVMVDIETILKTAAEHQADIIGFSGLITPSLDEMVSNAQEMERRGLKTPLLIGGATTSKAHTAIKIAPQYSGPTVHVIDASLVVGVCNNLLNPRLCDSYLQEVREDYARIREAYAEREDRGTTYVDIEIAFSREIQSDWNTTPIDQPEKLGLQVWDPSLWRKLSNTLTGLRSSSPGNCADAIPKFLKIKFMVSRLGNCMPMRNVWSNRLSGRNASIAVRCTACGMPTASVMTWNSTRMKAAARSYSVFTSCVSRWKKTMTHPSTVSLTHRPRETGRSIISAPLR